MFMVRRTPAALLAALLAAFALFTAGCSHVATDPEPDEQSRRRNPSTAVDARPGDHEARRSRHRHLGPRPDRRRDRNPRRADRGRPAAGAELQRECGAPPPAVGDLFERIRNGFALTDVDHDDGRARASAGSCATPPISTARSSAASATCTTSSTRSKRAACRSSSRCCRSSRAHSIPSPTRALAPRACGSSFPATGRRYGLKQNWYYDGRRDVVAATTAALDYLQFLPMNSTATGCWPSPPTTAAK